MPMSMKEAAKLTFIKVIPVCVLLIFAGLSTYYVLHNIFGLAVNANIISILFVAIGAAYIGRVITGRNQ